jgi:hypothetical protein
MDKPLFGAITTYSLLLPALIAIVKFKNAARSFLPFFIFIWTGVANELIGYFTIRYLRNNSVNNNIYVLAESLLLLWLFYSWQLFSHTKWLLWALAAAFVLFWMGEVFVFSEITRVAAYFRIFYSFPIVLLSISMINRLIIQENTNLLKNAAFIICVAFVIYFTFKILVEIFYIYGMMQSAYFRIRVYDIMRVINLLCNLIYAVALIWIPKKSSSLMPS